MRMLEDRAFGYYHFVVNSTPVAEWADRLVLNYTTSGTKHGLSKWPYLRDSRRGVGIDGYRFSYWAEDWTNSSGSVASFNFADSVALSAYNNDVHHLTVCTYPEYMEQHDTKCAHGPDDDAYRSQLTLSALWQAVLHATAHEHPGWSW